MSHFDTLRTAENTPRAHGGELRAELLRGRRGLRGLAQRRELRLALRRQALSEIVVVRPRGFWVGGFRSVSACFRALGIKSKIVPMVF